MEVIAIINYLQTLTKEVIQGIFLKALPNAWLSD